MDRLFADSFITLLLATSDTVSERNKNIVNNIINYFYQTSSVVQALFLAMALYPEVQKKAQAEIDSVVGPNRLPNFEDRPSLPYINAVVKESMRWHVPAPLGTFFYRRAMYHPDGFQSYSPHGY
jgi:cytochrome P450